MGKIFGLFLILAALGVFVSNEFISSAKGEDKFMMKAAQSGMAEVALSNLALQKSQSENVRRFAQMMVDDHTRANQELMTLAASKNVTLPTDMDSKHKAASSKLSGMSDAGFDAAYMKQMVKDHEEAVQMFQKQANQTGGDADVTAFASRTLPTLQSHLQMARSTSSNSMTNGNSNMNMNSNSDMNMNSNRNSNMNSNSNSNRNRNSNSNMNSNSNRNMNSNGNTNSNRNSNSNRNTNSNSNRNMNSNSNMNMNMNSNSNMR